MREKRLHPRTSHHATAILSHPSFHASVKIIDMSAGGIAVDMGSYDSPPVGTIVEVTIKKPTGKINQQALPMRIMHIQANGRVGLAFV